MARARGGRRPGFVSADTMRRIGRAVTAYERGNRDIPPVHFRHAGDDGDPLRLCKTTSAFNKGTSATLEVWEDGTFPNEAKSTGVTLEVRNKYANIAAGKFCSVALHGNGGWYIVSAECG